jgi:lactoylglutathione lyase
VVARPFELCALDLAQGAAARGCQREQLRAVTVDDVSAARAFLEKHFGMRPYGEGQKNFDVLFDDDGLVLTLISVGRSKQVSYPKTFHIGFIQPTEADVDEVNRRIREDGYDIDAPGGITVEVLC